MVQRQHKPSLLQKFFITFFPRSWVESMERESRRWIMTCQNCSDRKSIWEIGGIRWKASGSTITFTKCSTCGKWGRHKILYQA